MKAWHTPKGKMKTRGDMDNLTNFIFCLNDLKPMVHHRMSDEAVPANKKHRKTRVHHRKTPQL